MIRKPPFPNDDNFTHQIEAKIKPNRRFPFVQLECLFEANSEYSASLTGNKDQKNESKADAAIGLTAKCHICTEAFNRKSTLTFHLGHHHPEVEKPFVCSICPQEFYKTAIELNLHLGSKHPDQFKTDQNGKWIRNLKCQCPQCPKRFSCPSELNNHITFHTKEKAFVCDVCGSKYAAARELMKHKLKKKCKQIIELKSSRKFKCDYCERSVKSAASLRRHVFELHGIGKRSYNSFKKPALICLFCGYNARSSYELEQHNRIHTGETPFECENCNKAFRYKSNLHKHIRVNCPTIKATGLDQDEAGIRDAQRRFKCSICDQTFETKSQRNKHIKTHGDTFLCQFCPTGFKTSIGLKLHQVRVHPEQIKAFKCNTCGKFISNYYHFKIHELKCRGLKPKSLNEGQGPMDIKEIEEVEVKYDMQFPTRSDQLVKMRIKEYQCYRCPKNFKHKSQLLLHSASHKKNCQVRALWRHTSKKKYRQVTELNSSEEKVTENSEVESTASLNTKEVLLKCHICFREFHYQTILTYHLGHHHPEVEKPFSCSLCTESYGTPQELNDHLGTQHPDQNEPKLSKDVTENSEIKSTTDSDSEELIYKCHLCPRKFSNQAALTYHRGNYHPEIEKPFACSLCTESYGTSQKLNLHLGTEHPNEFKLQKTRNLIYAFVKKFQCPHCPRKFTFPSLLNIHLSCHSNEKPFVCDVCGSKFKQVKYLRNHKSKNKCQPVPEQTFQCQDNHNDESTEGSLVLAEEVDIKYEIPFPADSPAIDIDSNCTGDSNASIDPISAWVQNVTNRPYPLVECSDVLATTNALTVLKMEPQS